MLERTAKSSLGQKFKQSDWPHTETKRVEEGIIGPSNLFVT
jgi:hypothetical protein